MTVLAANYRIFELPWTPNDAEERHFKRLLTIGIVIWLLVVFGSELLPSPERPVAQPLPEEVVKLVLQPPPPKPKPVEEKKPEPKPIEQPKPVVPPPVVDKTEQARKVRKKIIEISWSTAIGNGYFAHTGGIVALFPEKPSRRFQHLRLLKSGLYSVMGHLNQTIFEGCNPTPAP